MAGRNGGVERHYVVAKQVWRMGGGAVMGLCPHVGMMHELDLWWGTGRECCPGVAQLGSHDRETPQSEGPEPAGTRPLSFYWHSGNGAEKSHVGLHPESPLPSPVFRQDAATPRNQWEAARVGAGAGCLQSSLKPCT